MFYKSRSPAQRPYKNITRHTFRVGGCKGTTRMLFCGACRTGESLHHARMQTAQFRRLPMPWIWRDTKERIAPRQLHPLAQIELRVEGQSGQGVGTEVFEFADSKLTGHQSIDLL